MTGKKGDDVKTRLLDAALIHVPFDGWTDVTFDAAISDIGVNPDLARAVCPRGATDLAVAYHRRGDVMLADALKTEDFADLRFRDKIARAVRMRIELIEDREVARRGSTLFSLPHLALTGGQLIWESCDVIWTGLGDTSEDINWYTKRATLSGVYASTLLFWMGDQSDGAEATWAFLDRRIDDVMRFEKAKAAFNKSPMGKIMAGPLDALSRVRPPKMPGGMPGRSTF